LPITQITPFSEAIDDELLLSFVDGSEVDLDYRMAAVSLLYFIYHLFFYMKSKYIP